jgi:DNA primase
VQGLKLFKKCKDVTVLCPFHEEKNQFNVLSPAKNP